MSRRTQAKIAAGVLAFSGVGAPPVAAAADPDTVSEGTAEVTEGVDPASFDIGADTVQLVDEAAPPAVAPPADAAAPPADDADDGPLELERQVDTLEPEVQVGSTVQLAAPPEEVPPTSESVPPPPVAEAPTVSSAAEHGEIRAERSKRTQVERDRPAQAATDRSPVVNLPRETPEPAVAPGPAPSTTTRVVAGTSAGQAKAGDRVHIVRRGESLWSIASDVLGGGASVAQVANEVNRLWELNADRIATGSPDLVFAGTRLRLR